MKRKNTNAPGILPALRRTAAYLKKSLPLIIVALVLAMLGTALTIVGPGQIGKIAALISSGLDGTIDLAAIARIGVLLVILAIDLGVEGVKALSAQKKQRASAQ